MKSVVVCFSELNDNKLSSVLDESMPLFTGLTSLSYLGLSANHIQSVSSHAFDGLDVLRHVDLTDNNISSLHDNTFSRLRNLHTVLVCLPVCLSVSVDQCHLCLHVCPSLAVQYTAAVPARCDDCFRCLDVAICLCVRLCACCNFMSVRSGFSTAN